MRILMLLGAAVFMASPAAAGAGDLIRLAQTPFEKRLDPFQSLKGAYLGQERSEQIQQAEAAASWFETDDGAVRFVLDQTAETALMRFDGEEEIYVLEPTPAARGDTVYKLDSGAPVLRLTALGGLTVYPQNSKASGAAFFTGDAAPLALPDFNARQIEMKTLDAAADVLAETGHEVAFQAPTDPTWFRARSNAVLADAIPVTVSGLLRVADDKAGRAALSASLTRVLFLEGDAAGLTWEDGTLLVTYARDAGPAGRPSSAEVARFLESAL